MNSRTRAQTSELLTSIVNDIASNLQRYPRNILIGQGSNGITNLSHAYADHIVRQYGVFDKITVEVHEQRLLRSPVHIHRESHEVVKILGKQNHLYDPLKGYQFSDGRWTLVEPQQIIDIPPMTEHGFSKKNRGMLYYLSVHTGDQSQDTYRNDEIQFDFREEISATKVRQ